MYSSVVNGQRELWSIGLRMLKMKQYNDEHSAAAIAGVAMMRLVIIKGVP